MNGEDMLLLAAFRGLSSGEKTPHPIRLHRLSLQARESLNDLIAGVELRLSLLGMPTVGVRADLFGLLCIDARPESSCGGNNLQSPDPATGWLPLPARASRGSTGRRRASR